MEYLYNFLIGVAIFGGIILGPALIGLPFEYIRTGRPTHAYEPISFSNCWQYGSLTIGAVYIVYIAGYFFRHC